MTRGRREENQGGLHAYRRSTCRWADETTARQEVQEIQKHYRSNQYLEEEDLDV